MVHLIAFELELVEYELEENMDQANATAKPSSTEETAEGTTLEPSKERVPIVWKGKANDDASSSKPAEAAKAPDTQPTPEPKPLQRMKPNAAFLLNVVADAQRGNERLCAEEATSASLTVLGQVMQSAPVAIPRKCC